MMQVSWAKRYHKKCRRWWCSTVDDVDDDETVLMMHDGNDDAFVNDGDAAPADNDDEGDVMLLPYGHFW